MTRSSFIEPLKWCGTHCTWQFRFEEEEKRISVGMAMWWWFVIAVNKWSQCVRFIAFHEKTETSKECLARTPKIKRRATQKVRKHCVHCLSASPSQLSLIKRNWSKLRAWFPSFDHLKRIICIEAIRASIKFNHSKPVYSLSRFSSLCLCAPSNQFMGEFSFFISLLLLFCSFSAHTSI